MYGKMLKCTYFTLGAPQPNISYRKCHADNQNVQRVRSPEKMSSKDQNIFFTQTTVTMIRLK